MKKIWSLLQTHVKSDFTWPYYLSIALFLAVSLILNGIFDFEVRIDHYMGTYWRLIGYFLLYGFAYYAGLALTLAFNKKSRPGTPIRFWLLSFSGIIILTMDSGFPYLANLMVWLNTDYKIYSWLFSVLYDALGFVFVFLPLFLLYPFFPVSKGEGYGLIAPHYDFKPYLMMLLMIAPLIAAASLTAGFSNYYPIYKVNSVAEAWGSPKWVPAVIFELFYALDFLNVELLFRGFMVVGLSQFLGKDAIMPMVTTYCFLHFGKPTGEAISSIFGGYILGILACYTRGIWGGVIIHVGIAGLMEFFAYIQK